MPKLNSLYAGFYSETKVQKKAILPHPYRDLGGLNLTRQELYPPSIVRAARRSELLPIESMEQFRYIVMCAVILRAYSATDDNLLEYTL